MLLPTISYCLLLVMNSPWLVKLRDPAALAKQGGGGGQNRAQNAMLAFSCIATCFLAVKAVVPILTAGVLDGTPLLLFAAVCTAAMGVAAHKVVRAGEALNLEALDSDAGGAGGGMSSMRTSLLSDEAFSIGSIGRMAS